jgi:GntR family transcriptional regulator, carbon starvation induced regulator
MDTSVTTRASRRSGRITRATLTEQLEEALRADILDGVLEPGRRLRAVELSERYGVSATPLREALQRLAVENLIELDPRFGATVAEITESDLRDIYDVLSTVACLALQRSIERGDDTWAEAIRRRFAEMSHAMEDQERAGVTDDETRRRLASEAAEAHWHFHNALYAACGSPWLLRFVATLHAHSERYRRLAMQSAGLRRDSRHEHEAIMLAALSRDASAAVEALREHLGLTVKLLVDRLGEHATTP